MSDASDTPRLVEIDYTNYRGDRGARLIQPVAIKFKGNEWHEPQWLLDALDIEKRKIRSFAMKDIHSWKPVEVAPVAEDQP